MNNTDNAFIKAYAQELAVALGRPAKQVYRGAARAKGMPSSPPFPAAVAAGSDGSPIVEEAAAAALQAPIDVQADVDWGQLLSGTVEVAPPAAYPSGPAIDQLSTLSPPDETTMQTAPADDLATRRRLDPADVEAPPQWHATLTEVADQPIGPPQSAPTKAGQESRGSLSPAQTAESDRVPVTTPPEVLDRPSHPGRGEQATIGRGEDAASDHIPGKIPAAPSTRSQPFRAQWEVDAFRWPASVDRVVNEYADWLNGALDRLVAESSPGGHVTALTGYARGEGRTTMALALARLAAGRGVSVALLDGDYDNPQVASQLGLSFDTGWNQRSVDPTDLSEVAVQSLEDRLTIVPLRCDLPAGPDASRDRAAAAIARLTAEHELLIIDAGPMFTAARHWFDQPTAKGIDGALVVRDLRTVTDEQLTDVVERLESRGIRIVGIAENFESPSALPSLEPSKPAS
jgi:Mrp family chromosome partitioning ATPase